MIANLLPSTHHTQLQRSAIPLAVFRGPTSKGRGGDRIGGKWRGRGKEGRKAEGRGKEGESSSFALGRKKVSAYASHPRTAAAQAIHAVRSYFALPQERSVCLETWYLCIAYPRLYCSKNMFSRKRFCSSADRRHDFVLVFFYVGPYAATLHSFRDNTTFTAHATPAILKSPGFSIDILVTRTLSDSAENISELMDATFSDSKRLLTDS